MLKPWMRTLAMATRLAAVLSAGACTDDAAGVLPPKAGAGLLSVLEAGSENGQTGWWPSLVIDANDNAHLSYCDAAHGDLKYAFFDAQGWHIETALSKGNVGKYTALGLDNQGTVAIVFYDQDTRYLRYTWREKSLATKAKAPWQLDTIAWGPEVGLAAQLRFDSRNRPHVFYYVPSGRLVHAVRQDNGAWDKTVIAHASGGHSVRIDPHLVGDDIWISYVDWRVKNTTANLAHKKASQPWHHEVVADRKGPGWHTQLVFGAKAKPDVLFSESFNKTVWLATPDGNDWKKTRLLEGVGAFDATLAQSASHRQLLVAYENVASQSAQRGRVGYIKHTAKGWQPVAIDPQGPAGQYLEIAANSRGEVLVVYYSDQIRGLKFYSEFTWPPAKSNTLSLQGDEKP